MWFTNEKKCIIMVKSIKILLRGGIILIMKKYEMKWQPGDYSMGIQTEIIHANSLEEATMMIKAKAKMLGKSINWIGKRQIL